MNPLNSAEPRRIRALVADDNAVVRTGLVTLLQAGDVEVVGEAVDGGHALELAGQLRPDVVLLDVHMPMVGGIDVVGPLSRLTRVLMLSYDEDSAVIGSALRGGAVGYLVHGTFGVDELLVAVTDAVTGRSSPLSPAASKAVVEALRNPPQPPAPAAPQRAEGGLSRREIDVMELIAQGRSNGEIARTLFISENTVKNHVNRIFEKLGVQNRGAAIARWLGTFSPGPQ